MSTRVHPITGAWYELEQGEKFPDDALTPCVQHGCDHPAGGGACVCCMVAAFPDPGGRPVKLPKGCR